MHNIIFVEEVFIVHLLLKKTEGYGSGIRIQNKEYNFTFICRVNPYKLEFVNDIRIIELFLEMI